MTILYCGDPHGRFDHILQAAADEKPVAVILLGDMEPGRLLDEELAPILDKVWFIHGNHDTDSNEHWERVWASGLAGRSLHGRVVTLPGGIRIAGLGGVFRETVWYPDPAAARAGLPAFRSSAEHTRLTPRQERWRGGPQRRHWSSVYPQEVDRLADLSADILVTHEAPGYHPNGFAILDTLAQSLGVKVAVHGHHHDALDSSSRWQAQGFRSFGVGLRGITAIDPDGAARVIVAGELDHARSHRLR